MAPDLVTIGGLTIDNVIAADGTVALARVGGNAAYSGVGARCFVEQRRPRLDGGRELSRGDARPAA